MKLPKVLFAAGFLVFLSCDTDNSTADDETTDDVTGTDDGDGASEETLVLVNAFPELSFSQPLDLQSPNDGTDRIFIAEKGGLIKVLENDENTQECTTFLDLSGNLSTTSEQGLLGFAFHPNYETNGYFYVCYTPSVAFSVISRFSVSTSDTNEANPNSELELLEIPQPFDNHNGGQIAFGPDGYLYIAMGDGGDSGDPQNNAQTRSNLLGNILRIDVDNRSNGFNYSIPPDNPFLEESNVRQEIYAYGFRNPWRMSFDTQTGDLWTGDVGQGKLEEIDIVVSGGNYGWKLFEGTDCFSGDCDASGLTPPIFEYNHDNGDRSITGGYVYRGSLNPSINGRYIYGDFITGRIWALDLDGNNNELLLESGLNIASFGTDAANELYICAFDGNIYKFEQN